MGKSFIDAKVPDKQERLERQDIREVHIGIFFDGTNNNMVQKSRFTGTSDVALVKLAQSGYYVNKKLTWWAVDKVPFLRDEEAYNVNLPDGYKPTNKSLDLNGNPMKGYSNVAVLHDNWKYDNGVHSVKDKKTGTTKECLFKHFYIEGAGATDTSHLFSKDTDGLGFGLDGTGVTALVAKAVKYVNEYIASEGHLSKQKSEVNVHFHLFGFSRGSTCARLFSHLVTREDGKALVREYEFKEFYDVEKYIKDGCLKVLDGYKLHIDFLGIYDTVASIGYIMQKDGEVHPKLRQFIHGRAHDFKENWHYKNVFEYGLYISGKEKKVCHICAMDEFRENFALTDAGSQLKGNTVEVFIPGCHSDLGGGYIRCEEEQEILLSKFRSPNQLKKEMKMDDKDVPTSLFLNDPQLNPTDDNVKYLNISSFNQLGWIDINWNNDKRVTISVKKKKLPITMRVIETDQYVKFKRRVRGGKTNGVYSNIPLRMMMEYGKKHDMDLFEDPIHYPIPNELKQMGDNMIRIINGMESGREWLYPGGSYSSMEYQNLRMYYLHFTATSELYHLNNIFNFKGVHTLEGTPGNLGNTPNYDLLGRFCRIVYHGDPKPPTSVESDLHYMYEFNSNNVLSI